MIATQLSVTPAPIDQSSNGKSTNTTPDGDGFSAQLARVDADSSNKNARTDRAPAKEKDTAKGQSSTSDSLASLLAAAGDDAISSVTALPLGQDPKATGSQAASSALNASAAFSTVVLALAQAEASKPQTDTAPQKAPPPAPANAQTGNTGDTQTGDVLSTLLSLAASSSTTSTEAGDGAADTTVPKPASRQTDRESDLDATGTSSPSPFTFQNLAISAQAALNALAPSFASATAKGGSNGQGGSASAALPQQIAANTKENTSSKNLESMLGINMPTQAAAANGNAAEADPSAVEVIKMDVSHIQAETHLIPAPPAPAQQIADFIVGSGLPGLGASNADANPAASGTASTSQSHAAVPQISAQTVTSPLKVLTLTLEPESLGAVTITMRLNDSGLNVQLNAAQAATASLIEHDKAKITDKLQALGYAVDSVDVKTAVTVQKMDQTSQGSLSDQSGTMQGQQARQDASSFSSGSGSRNDQAPADGRHESRQSPVQEESADLTRARSLGDGLYV